MGGTVVLCLALLHVGLSLLSQELCSSLGDQLAGLSMLADWQLIQGKSAGLVILWEYLSLCICMCLRGNIRSCATFNTCVSLGHGHTLAVLPDQCIYIICKGRILACVCSSLHVISLDRLIVSQDSSAEDQWTLEHSILFVAGHIVLAISFELNV